MANMGVAYRGPDPSLITLTNELRAFYGNPARTYEYVTGYKAPGNYSGHNPDSNGVVHAVDIFTDDQGNIPQAEGRALADRLRLVGKANNRFLYLIHDMSAGAPRPMIASLNTGWEWVDYNGPDAHSDHIHLSIADGYWGDPCPLPPSVYNDTSRWNVTGAKYKPQGGNITTITGGLTVADINSITKQLQSIQNALADITTTKGRVSLRQFIADGTRAAQEAASNTADINTASGPQSLRVFVAQGTRAAQAAQADSAGWREVAAQLAKAQGSEIDYAKVEAAAAAGAAAALADGVDLDATVNIKNKQ